MASMGGLDYRNNAVMISQMFGRRVESVFGLNGRMIEWGGTVAVTVTANVCGAVIARMSSAIAAFLMR